MTDLTSSFNKSQVLYGQDLLHPLSIEGVSSFNK